MRYKKLDTYFLAVFAFILFGMMASCKKTALPAGGTASFTIVNGVYDGNPIITNFNNLSGKSASDSFGQYTTALQISYGSWNEFSSYYNNFGLSLVQSSDTLSSLWTGNLNFPIGSVYSLFIMGDTLSVDTLLTKDAPPYYPLSDSSFGVRFVSLVKGLNPVSVDVAGLGNGSEVSSLAYKGVTGFKKYSANSLSASQYTFEFRDAASGTLLGPNTIYQLSDILAGVGNNTDNNNFRYRNFTLVLMGSPQNAGTQLQVVLVNNY